MACVAACVTEGIVRFVGMAAAADAAALCRFIHGARVRVFVPSAGTLRPCAAYIVLIRFFLRHRFADTIGRLGDGAFGRVVAMTARGVFGMRYGAAGNEAYDLSRLPSVCERGGLLDALARSDPMLVPLLAAEEDRAFMCLLHGCVRCMLPGCGERAVNMCVYWMCYRLSGDALLLELLRSAPMDGRMWFAA